jgi:hypothetical protein
LPSAQAFYFMTPPLTRGWGFLFIKGLFHAHHQN